MWLFVIAILFTNVETITHPIFAPIFWPYTARTEF